MPSIKGKHIVVTGASSGIGAELCCQLGQIGAKVTLSARRIDKLEQVAEELQRLGGTAHCIQTDVTKHQEVFGLANAARQHFGEIDVWVNNAGGGIMHKLLDATEEDMLWQYRLNCLSSLWAYQAVVPGMIERGSGQVVDINSLGGKAGFAFGGGYVAAKAAMSAMGDALRQELLGTGVCLTTVYPGVTDSDFSAVRPDRTGGSALGDGARLRNKAGFLRNTVLKQQSASEVAKWIIRAIKRPVPTVYPHRWGLLGVWLFNHYPKLMLGLIERSRN